MEFQRVDRSDPERIFMTVYNSYSTASFTNGQWAGWDIATDKNGYSVTKVSGAGRPAIAGVAVQTIASGEYGLVQVWGYKRDARVLGGSGSVTSKASIGHPLYFDTSRFCPRVMERNSAAVKTDWGKFPCGIVIEPLNTAAIATYAATSGQYKTLVRCL